MVWIAVPCFALTAWVSGCSSTPESAGAEHVGQVHEQVNNGHLDESNSYPFIGAIHEADVNGNPTSGPFCSAILITPAWALTSAHCFVGAYMAEGILAEGVPINQQDANLNITFDQYDLVDSHSPTTALHTLGTSGHVLVLHTSPIDMASDSDKSRDLALVQLDRRMSAVTPLHAPYLGDPSIASNSCAVFGNDFTATLVGYGPNGGGAYISKGDSPGMGWRNYASSDGWFREGAGSGSLFSNAWFAPTALLGEYEGVNPGDSGGALLRDGILCGVNSAWLPGLQTRWIEVPYLPDIPYTVPVIYTDTAAVDSSSAQNFLKNVVDTDNRFMGECLPGEGPADKQNLDWDNDLIPDACDPCPHVPDPDYRRTGSFAAWPDQDKDGVPDVCDNCPTHAYGNGYDANHEQPDSDNDGVGDACDYCEHSEIGDLTCCHADEDCPGHLNKCFPVTNAKGVGGSCLAEGGRCAYSPDSDDDAIGDYCDSCPATEQFGQYANNSDTDNDGVGDVCDACPGLHSYGAQTKDAAATCTFQKTSDADDQYCIGLTNNSLSRCNFNGRCTEGLDTDQDGVGDACDNCPQTATLWQANCNLDTEIASGVVSYPYIGDACDPNPCSYADPTYPEPNVDVADSGDVWNMVELDTVLLPKSEVGAFSYVGTPTGTVGARTCECLPTPGLTEAPTALNCQSQCPLESNEYSSLVTRWKKPSVYHHTWVTEEFKDPADPATFDEDAEFDQVPLRSPEDLLDPTGILTGPGSAFYRLAWDVSKGNGLGSVAGAGALNKSLRAVFWTHVKDVQGMQPGAAAAFRPWSNHYVATVFGKPGVDVSPELHYIPLGPSSLWPEGCPNCGLSLDRPIWDLDPWLERLVIRGRNIAVDVTGLVDSNIMADLAETGRVRRTVEESDRWIRDDSVRFASVSSDGTTVGAVAVAQGGWLREAHQSEVVKSGVAEGELMEHVFSTPLPQAGTAPSPRTQFGAVLSATENALFILGGIGDDARPTGDLWQYDPPSRVWFSRPLSGVRPKAVLAATIHPESRSLYVVDEFKLGWSRWARLLEIDLSTNHSRLVGMWPRHTAVDAVFLSSGPDGQLVLAGSSSSRKRYVGVVFQPSDQGLPSIQAAFSGRGVLGVRPTLDKRGLTLPMNTNTGVNNTFLSRDQLYRPWWGRHIGECL